MKVFLEGKQVFDICPQGVLDSLGSALDMRVSRAWNGLAWAWEAPALGVRVEDPRILGVRVPVEFDMWDDVPFWEEDGTCLWRYNSATGYFVHPSGVEVCSKERYAAIRAAQ